jgi:hypothetical protein
VIWNGFAWVNTCHPSSVFGGEKTHQAPKQCDLERLWIVKEKHRSVNEEKYLKGGSHE